MVLLCPLPLVVPLINNSSTLHTQKIHIKQDGRGHTEKKMLKKRGRSICIQRIYLSQVISVHSLKSLLKYQFLAQSLLIKCSLK